MHKAPVTAYTNDERCSLSPDSENFHILFEGTKNTFYYLVRQQIPFRHNKDSKIPLTSNTHMRVKYIYYT